MRLLCLLLNFSTLINIHRSQLFIRDCKGNNKGVVCFFSFVLFFFKRTNSGGKRNLSAGLLRVGVIIVCAVSRWFEWKSIVTVCSKKKKKKKNNSVVTGQGQHVTGTCLNNSPLLTHQCIGFCLFLTPFKTA